jgi:hypothetical protein
MKRLGALAAAVLSTSMSQALCAQGGDALDRLKACSQFEGAERLKCVDELLQEVAPEPVPTPGPNWIVSETTSPVDYTPQISAVTTTGVSAQDAPSSLGIRCHGQRTELLISTAGSWKRPTHGLVKVVYQINTEPPVEEQWRSVEAGKSLAFQGDAVGLLRSMPNNGQMVFDVYAGKTHTEGKFQLTGLDLVRRKIAVACNWSQP